MGRGARVRVVVALMVVTAVHVVLVAGVAVAGVSDPGSQQPPGSIGTQIASISSWMKWFAEKSIYVAIALAASAAAIGHFGEHSGAAMKARKWVLGAMGGALLLGGGVALAQAFAGG